VQNREGDEVPVPLYEAKADLFRALGHPARIRVLELLSDRDHAVHELLAEIPLEPSALSQQLAVLRRTGLVRQQRVRGEVVYSIVVPQTRELLGAARMVLRELVAGRAELERALEPTMWDPAPPAEGPAPTAEGPAPTATVPT
jgi:ArsR family transcriptional regulator